MLWYALVSSREPERWRKRALDKLEPHKQTDGLSFYFQSVESLSKETFHLHFKAKSAVAGDCELCWANTSRGSVAHQKNTFPSWSKRKPIKPCWGWRPQHLNILKACLQLQLRWNWHSGEEKENALLSSPSPSPSPQVPTRPQSNPKKSKVQIFFGTGLTLFCVRPPNTPHPPHPTPNF